MDDVKRKKILWIIARVAVIVLFAVVAIIMATQHEPWGDEAQSYLIARDNSYREILTQAKFEGTTPFWFIIIRTFIKIGGNYNTYFILPLIFTLIGLIIFEFKVKAPWYIKILLPFTYFIFYQYTIIARSYCMVFPALMLIASIYQEREKRKVLYCIAMLFLMSICSYTMLIAGSLLLIDIIEMFKAKSFKVKNIIPLAVIALGLLVTFIMILPDPECNFVPNHSKNFLDIIYHATIGNFKVSLPGSIVVTILFFLGLGFAIYKEKDKKVWKVIWLLILFAPVIVENIFISSQIWHVGILTLLIFAAFMMNDMINKNLVIKIMMVVICLIQISWSIITIVYDMNNNYSAAKEVATYIKDNNYENVVYGYGFDITAIQPYFEHNVFKNHPGTKGFWVWKLANYFDEGLELLEDKEVIKDSVFIVTDFSEPRYKPVRDKLKEKGYEEQHFEGELFTKTYSQESKGYWVLTKPSKDS